MQIVININEDGQVSAVAQTAADDQVRSDSFAALGIDGGSAPYSSEDVFTGEATESSVLEMDAPLNDGGSA